MGRKTIEPADPSNLTKKEKSRLAVREYQRKNKEATNERSRKYRESHRSYFKEKKKEERARIKNDPEYRAQEKARVRRGYIRNQKKCIAASKAYADAHVEELKAYRQANSERRGLTSKRCREAKLDHYKAVSKKWRSENMHVIRKHIALRRAREINATIGDPKEIATWEKEWKSRLTNTCEWCRMETLTENCQTDHAEPLILGGAHNLENLVIACQPCNNRKRGKPLSKWLEILGRDQPPVM